MSQTNHNIRIRFGLRALMLAVLVVACILGYWQWQEHRRQKRAATVQALLDCPDRLGDYSNPATVIKTVNLLRSLGHAQAILAMREYEDVCASSSEINKESLEFVVPLVFEPRVANQGYPEPTLSGYRLMRSDWNVARILLLHQGIPFAPAGGTFYIDNGSRTDTRYLVDWAERDGKLIADEIRPANNPIAAADSLQIDSATWRRIQQIPQGSQWTLLGGWKPIEPTRDNIASQFRFRARTAVKHLVDDPSLDWEQLKLKLEEMGIYWDRNTQSYRIKNASSNQN